MTEFKVGMIVQLKSGGPKMTVTGVGKMTTSDRTIYCEWFSGSKAEGGTFHPESLNIVKEEQGK